MPGTFRGLLQGLAYTLPQVGQIILQDRNEMYEQGMNEEYLRLAKDRMDIEQKREERDEARYKDIEMPQAEATKDLTLQQVKNMALANSLTEKFGEEMQKLEIDFKKAQLGEQRFKSDPKRMQETYDLTNRHMNSTINLIDKQIAEIDMNLLDAPMRREMARIEHATTVLRLQAYCAEDPKLLDTVFQSKTPAELYQELPNMKIPPRMAMALMNTMDTFIGLQSNISQRATEYGLSVYEKTGDEEKRDKATKYAFDSMMAQYQPLFDLLTGQITKPQEQQAPAEEEQGFSLKGLFGNNPQKRRSIYKKPALMGANVLSNIYSR